MSLSEIDAKILRYFKKYKCASIEQLKLAFPEIVSMEYRINELSNPKFPTAPLRQNWKTVTVEFASHTEYLGTFRLSPFGEKALQDYDCEQKTEKKKFMLHSVWTPILITLATNLLLSGIKQLLPLIREWLLHIL